MSSFESAYQENYRKLYSVALKFINDKDVVSDILQEVFVYYFRKSKEGHSIDKPKSWLMRATINKCIDHSKHQARYREVESTDIIAEDQTEQQQEQEMLRMALSKLNPKEKTLALLYGEGMSYKEMSEISGIKLSSVGKTLSRTLDKLQTTLKQMNDELY